ncbi:MULTISPECIES: family 10 glycosylhydrolase [Bacillus]|uniref:YngK protein n=1 Tax=Bacillus wiedmannii TaxID=1890302 RepID=A0AB37YZ67_9BACI|nr:MULTISPECIES: family 10 glycosylhydrolase [Bacillus]UNK32911.1 family 10 glycosylhydrolase [Bacillus sp. N5-665]SCC63149.1 YngK protein [Bacillus wiedmannii]
MFIKKVISRGRVQSLLIPILFLALIISASSVEASEQQAINKKRELRAVWISTVFNIDWPVKGASADEQKKQFINILDDVKSMGMNAVVVQVRPTGDAFYPSKHSPWSEYLTGTQGKDPGYDPLAFMVEEAHKRNLEFHAWLNPYRITTSHQDVNKLAVNHPAKQHPDWVVKHGKQLLYNPGIPAVRDYIKNSTLEIVQNYDVDAIHMDDYFYPYADAENFKDETTYETYGKGENKDDWRRENVNTLVRDLSTSIKQTKSHVKFGISPFGIWRNKHNDTQGSETNGLSAYDNIYADSRLWVHKEWVDYLTPQVYWSIGHNAANYDVITKWWNNEAQGKNIHLYIGQAAYKINNDSDKAWENPTETNNQLALNSTLQNVKGSMFFSYRNLKTNILGIKDQLRANAYKYPALIPTMPWLDNSAPSKPSIHSVTDGPNGATISWNNNAGNDAAYFVIYRFNRGQLIDGNNSSVIVTTIRNNGSEVLSYVDKAVTNSSDYTYAVSAVDRLHNESDLVPASTPEPEPKPEPKPKPQFKDVSTNHWALTYINFLAEKKIISGFPDGTFKPEDRLTRLQAIFMILNEKGIKDLSNVSNPNFIDVNPSTYGYKEIAKAVELGIVTGKVNDSGQKYFEPNGVLTRAEMATILTRNYNLNGTHSEEFSDVPKGYWAHSYIQSLAKNGIAVGYGNGMFGPGDPLTREQFATMMARTINEELR